MSFGAPLVYFPEDAGPAGDTSLWATYPAVQNVDMADNSLLNVSQITNSDDFLTISGSDLLTIQATGFLNMLANSAELFGTTFITIDSPQINLTAAAQNAYSLLALSTVSGGLSQLTRINPGAAGYVLTTHGPNLPATWEQNSSDASQWSTYPAVSAVNLDGNNIKGPNASTTSSMTISLPNITSGSANGGNFILGGDINSGGGAGSSLTLTSGGSTSGLGGDLIIRPGISGSGDGAQVTLQGGASESNGDGGLFVVRGGLSIDGVGGDILITGGIGATSADSDWGTVQLYSPNSIILNGTNINVGALEENEYNSLVLGPFDGQYCPILKIAPGAVNYIWTSHGPGTLPTWEPNASDVSQWANYPATVNIDMAGNSIVGPDSITVVDMTIALPDISQGANIPAGTLTIGGDTNLSGGGPYFGSNTYIRAGNSQALVTPGKLYLMAGSNPSNTWGDIHVSCFNMIWDVAGNLNMQDATITVNNLLSTSNVGLTAPVNLTIAPGSTNNDGQAGASVYLYSGQATTGAPGDIHIQPLNNTADVKGSTYVGGATIQLVAGTTEAEGEVLIGTGSSSIGNSFMITGIFNVTSAPIQFISGAVGEVLAFNDAGVPSSRLQQYSATSFSSGGLVAGITVPLATHQLRSLSTVAPLYSVVVFNLDTGQVATLGVDYTLAVDQTTSAVTIQAIGVGFSGYWIIQGS